MKYLISSLIFLLPVFSFSQVKQSRLLHFYENARQIQGENNNHPEQRDYASFGFFNEYIFNLSNLRASEEFIIETRLSLHGKYAEPSEIRISRVEESSFLGLASIVYQVNDLGNLRADLEEVFLSSDYEIYYVEDSNSFVRCESFLVKSLVEANFVLSGNCLVE